MLVLFTSCSPRASSRTTWWSSSSACSTLLVADPAGADQRLQRDRAAGVLQELPEELFERPRIDGAGSATISVRIVLPLSKAVLAVVGLFYAVAYWNAFFNALLYINPPPSGRCSWCCGRTWSTRPTIGGDQVSAPRCCRPQESIQMAILVIAIVPILVVYPFLQRHFAKGVLIGAVKG